MDFPYVYDDEDNAPLNIEPRKPIIYSQRFNSKGELVTFEKFYSFAEMARYYRNRKDPDAPEEPANGCWNCRNHVCRIIPPLPKSTPVLKKKQN